MSFAPKLGTLPPAQRALWPDLAQVPRRFILYGGTGLALRLGHRQSEDFYFFTDAPMDPDELLRELPLLKGAVVRQKALNTLTVTVQREEAVKLSFFGLTRRRVHDPESTDDGVLTVASALDIAGFKMAVVSERAEAKDYLDVYALLEDGINLGEALGAAAAIHGGPFNPMITLKALTYFEDGDLPALPEKVKQALRGAVGIKHIARLEPLPGGLVPGPT
jgi:hypothetical protein